MREAAFVKQNKDKWSRYENVISNNVVLSPEDLSDLYLEVTEDLSYAQTFYPESNTLIYLNGLATRVHQKIYKTKKESSNRLWRFYKTEFPLLFYRYQKQLLISFLVFLLFSLVGCFSVIQEEGFARMILGNIYVEQTLQNIQENDPMAIYKQQTEMDMFLGITINNIKVALYTFVFGILLGIGTVYVLMQNALMIGVFQYFMFQQGIGWESVRTIWIHGTIEISVIIIAGAGGLVLGRSLLFPGTYTRLQSFISGVKDGLKILLSTLPFFIIAGFLESFVTRHTEMPDWLAVSIIVLSFAAILFYYVFYPRYLFLKQKQHAG